MPGEFELIRRYFADRSKAGKQAGVRTGIGDDAAVVRVPSGHELVITTDVLVEGVHFAKDTGAVDIGHKALAVNLSDLAAMGADPAWFTLNLSMPKADNDWLQDFSEGLFAMADDFNIALIGGDTVQGPLVIGIQACGTLPKGQALLRSGARAGDAVYVSETLGDAALALQSARGVITVNDKELEIITQKLNRPVPRIVLGSALRSIASSCIDISDGLLADLGHILDSSNVGASVHWNDIPLSMVYQKHMDRLTDPYIAITAGDDYELCFTVAADRITLLEKAAADIGVTVSRIGTVETEPGLRIRDQQGKIIALKHSGHEHFV